MDSAIAVANSLRENETLTSLGIRHNSFADYPTQALAMALCDNYALQKLDLSYNGLTPTAAMVLGHALKVKNQPTMLALSVEQKSASHNMHMIKPSHEQGEGETVSQQTFATVFFSVRLVTLQV
ncbi:unnamed protein product [Choristocarpus tenellus]